MLCDEEVLPVTDFMTSDKSSVTNDIPLKCKWNFVLSDIWIPAHLLLNRKPKPANYLEPVSIYHTLGGADVEKISKSFSVYDDSVSEIADGEIFVSDNEDEFLLNFGNSNEIVQCSSPLKYNTINNSVEASESFEDTIKSLSACSLHDVESVCAENVYSRQTYNSEFNALQPSSNECRNLDHLKVSEANFKVINKKQLNCDEVYCVGKETSPGKHQIKKEKSQGKKAQKYMPLGSFLQSDDYYSYDFNSEEPEIDYFYENIMRNKDQSNLYELSDFPSLTKSCSNFETENENRDLSMRNDVDFLKERTIHKEKNGNYTVSSHDVTETSVDTNHAQIVIENIPLGVSEKDIFDIILGYGELKEFSLKPAGNFLTAELELDLVSDLDWIIECLNGSQPFGASSEMLKCYKKEDGRQ